MIIAVQWFPNEIIKFQYESDCFEWVIYLYSCVINIINSWGNRKECKKK